MTKETAGKTRNARRAAFLWLFAAAAMLSSAGDERLDEAYLRYFEARNDAANMMLASPGAPAPEIVLERPESMARTTCPACEGKGELVLKEPDYGQFDGRMNKGKTTRKTCPVCGGRRFWRAYTSPKILAEEIARARSQFISRHQARGDVPAGMAFVPRASHDAADRKRLKLVEETYGKPCTRCEWSGLEPCKDCKGEGAVKCSNKECKGGWVVTTTTTTTSHSPGRSTGYSRNSGGFHRSSRRGSRTVKTTVTVTECTVCKGAAKLLCDGCRGMRAAACTKCHGLGFRQKR